jgi:hypothetical protein
MNNKYTLPVAMLIGMLALSPVAAFAQSPARLSDNEVKKLLEQVYEARDKFEGNLDNSVKNSTMKTGTTDAKVETVLQDLQDNAAKLRDRFKPDYAAGAEAETLLKQANMINAAMERAPVTKGRSQWDLLVVSLRSLAGVYGTTFPLPAGASVRRINDRETAAAAESVAKSADRIRNQIDKSKELPKPEKENGKELAKALEKAADTLKSKIADGKPATGEVRSVFDLVSKLRAFLTAHPTPSAAADASTMSSAMATLQQSFMLPATPM